MRKLAVPILLAGIVLPALAKEPVATQLVTVAELEQALAGHKGLPDKKLAMQISDMKLTERLSDAQLSRLEGELSGRLAKIALLAVADESAFLDPPATEIPSSPAPDHATQVELINRAIDYVLKTVPTLPNFFATRTTTRFVGTPLAIPENLHDALFPSLEESQRLTDIGTTRATVRYSKGLEVFTDPKKGVKTECHTDGATSVGTFGEILPRVAYEATQGRVVWSHWEQGPAGPLAVFHYAARLMYKFPRRCPNEIEIPPTLIDYQGEIAVNPNDGSVFRVTEMCRYKVDLLGSGPQNWENNMMVRFGSVEIGGRTYLCPVNSVFLGFNPHSLDPRIALDRFDKSYGLSEDPRREWLNDMTFTDYHLFRAKMQILTGPATERGVSPGASDSQANPSRVFGDYDSQLLRTRRVSH
jgi:hypothetical protein